MRFNFTFKTSLIAALFLFAFGKISAQSSVVINEVMASNMATITDESGEYDDWIELFNNTNSAVNLGGWHISDNPDNLDKWAFPTNTSIPAMGYIIIWADEDSSQGPLHANFKLSSMGEQLLLVNASGNTIQDISFGAQQVDKGYARSPNGTGNFVIKNPTYKANNDTGISAVGEEERAAQLSVYPNPASGGEVVLRSEKPALHAVGIYDQLGRQRWSAQFFNQATVDTNGWPAGIYFVKSGSIQQVLVIQ